MRPSNPGPHVDGVLGSVSHAYINQLDYHMGQMSIKSHPSTSGTSAQNAIIPNQTSKVNLMKSMQPNNPQQLGGKNKRNKKKNFNTKKGTTSTQNTLEGGTKKKKKSCFPTRFVGRTIPLISFLKRMKSINCFHNSKPPNTLLS
jgi:hypothetical protein